MPWEQKHYELLVEASKLSWPTIANGRSNLRQCLWTNRATNVSLAKIILSKRLKSACGSSAPWEGHLSTSYYVRPVRPPPMREWEAPPTADPTDEIG